MIVVEAQIDGQVSDAYLTAEKANTIGSVPKTVFNRPMSDERRLRDKPRLLEEP